MTSEVAAADHGVRGDGGLLIGRDPVGKRHEHAATNQVAASTRKFVREPTRS